MNILSMTMIRVLFSKSIFKRYDVEFKVTKDQHDILDYVYGDHQSIYEESDHYRLCFEMEGDQMIKQLAYQFNVNAELIKPEHLKIELDAELEFMLRETSMRILYYGLTHW